TRSGRPVVMDAADETPVTDPAQAQPATAGLPTTGDGTATPATTPAVVTPVAMTGTGAGTGTATVPTTSAVPITGTGTGTGATATTGTGSADGTTPATSSQPAAPSVPNAQAISASTTLDPTTDGLFAPGGDALTGENAAVTGKDVTGAETSGGPGIAPARGGRAAGEGADVDAHAARHGDPAASTAVINGADYRQRAAARRPAAPAANGGVTAVRNADGTVDLRFPDGWAEGQPERDGPDAPVVPLASRRPSTPGDPNPSAPASAPAALPVAVGLGPWSPSASGAMPLSQRVQAAWGVGTGKAVPPEGGRAPNPVASANGGSRPASGGRSGANQPPATPSTAGATSSHGGTSSQRASTGPSSRSTSTSTPATASGSVLAAGFSATDWHARASDAQAAARLSSLPAPLQPGSMEAEVADILTAPPAADSNEMFVVSHVGPEDTVWNGQGVRTARGDIRASFDAARGLAADRSRTAKTAGAWVYRVAAETAGPPQARGRALAAQGRVDGGRIVGGVFIGRDGAPTSLVVANPDADAFAGAMRAAGGAPSAAATTSATPPTGVRLGDPKSWLHPLTLVTSIAMVHGLPLVLERMGARELSGFLNEAISGPEQTFVSQMRSLGTRLAYFLVSKAGMAGALQAAAKGEGSRADRLLVRVDRFGHLAGMSRGELDNIAGVRKEIREFAESVNAYKASIRKLGLHDEVGARFPVLFATEADVKNGNVDAMSMRRMPEGEVIRHVLADKLPTLLPGVADADLLPRIVELVNDPARMAAIDRDDPQLGGKLRIAKEGEEAYVQVRAALRDTNNAIDHQGIQKAAGSTMVMDTKWGTLFKLGALGFPMNSLVAAAGVLHPTRLLDYREIIGNGPNALMQFKYLTTLNARRYAKSGNASDAWIVKTLRNRQSALGTVQHRYGWLDTHLPDWRLLEDLRNYSTKRLDEVGDPLAAINDLLDEFDHAYPDGPLDAGIADAGYADLMGRMRDMTNVAIGQRAGQLNTRIDYMALPSVARYVMMGAYTVATHGDPAIAALQLFHGGVMNPLWLLAQQGHGSWRWFKYGAEDASWKYVKLGYSEPTRNKIRLAFLASALVTPTASLLYALLGGGSSASNVAPGSTPSTGPGSTPSGAIPSNTPTGTPAPSSSGGPAVPPGSSQPPMPGLPIAPSGDADAAARSVSQAFASGGDAAAAARLAQVLGQAPMAGRRAIMAAAMPVVGQIALDVGLNSRRTGAAWSAAPGVSLSAKPGDANPIDTRAEYLATLRDLADSVQDTGDRATAFVVGSDILQLMPAASADDGKANVLGMLGDGTTGLARGDTLLRDAVAGVLIDPWQAGRAGSELSIGMEQRDAAAGLLDPSSVARPSLTVGDGYWTKDGVPHDQAIPGGEHHDGSVWSYVELNPDLYLTPGQQQGADRQARDDGWSAYQVQQVKTDLGVRNLRGAYPDRDLDVVDVGDRFAWGGDVATRKEGG
ncbi:MAG: hypothetical protein ACTHL8_09980, partial [Burkholderiaceae bacterium]